MGLGLIGSFKEFNKHLRKQSTYHKTADTIGKSISKVYLTEQQTVGPALKQPAAVILLYFSSELGEQRQTLVLNIYL